jgi:hypothetical protein
VAQAAAGRVGPQQVHRPVMSVDVPVHGSIVTYVGGWRMVKSEWELGN